MRLTRRRTHRRFQLRRGVFKSYRLAGERYAEQFLLQLVQSIAQLGSLLELEVLRGIEHFALDALELALQVFFRHRFVFGLRLRRLELLALLLDIVDAVDDVLDALRHSYGSDAEALVVGDLLASPAFRFLDRRLHRVGHLIGIQDRGAVDVPRGTTYGLDERALGAQESFLVGVEHRHQRDLRDVETFAEKIDADQHVELAQPQVADDLHPL